MNKFLINILFCLIFFIDTASSEDKYSVKQQDLYNIWSTCEVSALNSFCIEEGEALLKTFPKKVTDPDDWMYHYTRFGVAADYMDSDIIENQKKAIQIFMEILNDPIYEADNWYKTTAATNLGWTFYTHRNFRDLEKAFKYTKYAADHNSHWGLNHLGVFYDQGRAVKQNYNKAFEYYTKAAEMGNNYAHGNLAVLYTFGLGVKKNYERAIIHLKLEKFEWDYESDEFSSLMVLFNKKRLPINANEYISWIENAIIKNQTYENFQTLAWLSDIDKSIVNEKVTEYKWHYLTTKLSKDKDTILRSLQEIDFLTKEFLINEEEIILAKKQAENWIKKNWKN